MPEVVQSLSALSQIILVRLLDTSKSRPGPKRVQSDLKKLVSGPISSGEWGALVNSTIEEMEALGLLTVRPYRLTDLGRTEAAQYLGVRETDFPQRMTWGTLKNKYLVPRALGLPVADKSVREKIARSEELRGTVVAQHFDLRTSMIPTNSVAIDALVWRELGIETDEKLTLENLKRHFLSKFFAGEHKLDSRSIKAQLPAVVTGARNSAPEEIRMAVLKKLLKDADLTLPSESESTEGYTPESSATSQVIEDATDDSEATANFDLEGFANTVNSIAKRCAAQDGHSNRVLISHVWERFQSETFAQSMSEADFKSRLLEAYQAGSLRLADAEFRQYIDVNEIRQSKVVSGDKEYLFVSVK